MIQTNTQYMSDPARAERVIRRFMNVTLGEMKQMQTRNYTGYLTNKLILTEGLSEKKLQNMPYLELACLIASVGGKPWYDGYDHDSRARQMMYYQCLAGILRDGRRRSIPVRLFMALPLHAFYACLDRICGAGHPSLQSVQVYSCYKDSYTVGDFVNEKIKLLNQAWQPVKSLTVYEGVIKTAYRDLGILLVDSFHTTFSQQICAADICNKYSFSFEEEGIIHPMFYPADDENELPL
ncbi:MAG: hypothetical protein HFI38_07165 [Lachnospiraceae bacterium]|jgi:hypothetical protein|nr:hypothetical protein [Lachnospiraceae bacterium]